MATILGLSQVAPIILILGFTSTPGQGELRFCLNGPHRMKDSDCPGGFVFKEAITPTCKYYARDGDQTGIVLSAPTNPCDETTERAIENEGDDLSDISSLAILNWEEFETNDTMGAFDPANICHDECLPDWEDHNTATDEDPIPEDFDKEGLSDEDKKFCKKTNKEMFIRILMDDDDEDEPRTAPSAGTTTTLPPAIPSDPITNKPIRPKVPQIPSMIPSSTVPPVNSSDNSTDNPSSAGQAPAAWIDLNGHLGNESSLSLEGRSGMSRRDKPKSPESSVSLVTLVPYDPAQLNVIKLLAKSMKVVVSACGPFVNEDFYEQILKGMIFVSKLVEDRLLDLSTELYKSVGSILDHCLGKKLQEFVLNGTKCDGMEKVEGVYFLKSKNYWPYRLTGRSFRWGVQHPILDAAWTTIEIAQSLCFDSFTSNMMMGHVYHMAMEGLYPSKIKLLWRVYPELKNDNFWNNLLQTHDLNVTMKNLDACAYGARNSSIFDNPLPRPYYTMEDAAKEPPGASETHEPPKGWNKTIERYWDYYDKQGGFKKASEEFGRCFQANDHLEEKDDMIEDFKKTC